MVSKGVPTLFIVLIATAAAIAQCHATEEPSSVFATDATNEGTPSDALSAAHSTGSFVATDEWQELEDGQAIPAGLHVQLDMTTGKRRVKLLENAPGVRPSIQKVGRHEGALVSIEKNIELTNEERLELRERLRKLKDEPSSPFSEEVEARHNALRKAMEDAMKELDGSAGDVASASAADANDDDEGPRSWEELKSAMGEIEKVLKMRSDVEIMKEHIGVLRNGNATTNDRIHALSELEEFVHQVDNAVDLDSIGGLKLVVGALDDADADVRALAALVLGSAMQSNPPVQLRALEHGAIPRLVALATDRSDVVSRRSLYALSAIARHYPQAQEAMFASTDSREKLLTVFAREDHGSRLKLCTLLGDLLGGTPGATQDTSSAAVSKWLPALLVPDLTDADADNHDVSRYAWCDAVQVGLSGGTNSDVESSLRAMGALMDRCGDRYTLLEKEGVVRSLAEKWVAQAEEAQREGTDEYLGQLIDLAEYVADRIRSCVNTCLPVKGKPPRRMMRRNPDDL